ncbi:MAG TPA: PorP/SprF family type IX secretion system membrane protein [Prolixibacteraceae bacterium]|nr:PorP/SprF family type IX secretion system membrane protein [Prolixibacteraceae bacterium]
MRLQRFRYLFIVLLFLFGVEAMAQTDISMPSSWYNRANYNPASITRVDYLYLFSNVRKQWVGVDGAPTTFNIQASEYFNDLKSAVGMSLVTDKIGVVQTVDFMATYAYRMEINRYRWFSMGLSAGIYSRSINGTLYEAATTTDPSIDYRIDRVFSPDVNLGFEYQTQHFIYSLSSTHLLSIGKSDNLYLNSNHRYASVIYKSTDPLLFNYQMGLQLVNRQNVVVLEGNACFRFKHQTGLVRGPREVFELGMTYRTSQQISLLFGLYLKNNIRVGYVYNQSFSIGYLPNSTHELMFEYRIPKKVSFNHQYHNRDYWYN